MTDVLPVRSGDAAMGDVDRDGDLDLLLTGARGGPSNPNPSTVLYRNEGDTTLLIEVENELAEVDAVHMIEVNAAGSIQRLWKSTAAWGDYDNDGDLDLAIMGVNANSEVFTGVYRLTSSSGNFSLAFQAPDPVHSGDLIWGDLDHDGDLDLTVCGVQEGGEPLTAVYVNSGGTFSTEDVGLINVGYCSLDLGDFEIDGDMDFLITGTDEDGNTLTRVYESIGRGRFRRYPQTFVDLLFSSGAWGDYDADGYLDFIVTGARLSPLLMEGKIALYRYDTTNVNFQQTTSRVVGAFEGDPVSGRYLGGVSWGDLDNSGYMDFIVTGSESPRTFNATQIFLNREVHYLEKSPPDRFDGGFRGRAIMTDYDVDRDLDVILFGENPGVPSDGVRVRMLRNNRSFGKSAPRPPEALGATVTGRTVQLNWSAGEDRQTPLSGLTYNIRIGTSPGASDIVSPMSLDNGKRMISAPGNMGTGRQWQLYDLLPGTYYWSVQTLDQTFAGSVFSVEESFTVQ